MPGVGDTTSLDKSSHLYPENHQKNNMEELKNSLIKKAEEVGVFTERLRILAELNKIDLPPGVWPLIKKIISPD